MLHLREAPVSRKYFQKFLRHNIHAATLAAQAKASWLAAYVSIGGSLIALVGTVLVLTAYRETRRSATAAVDAAKYAGSQVKLAREEFIATNRLRLIVRNISLETKDGTSQILYALVNIGGSSCKLVDSFVMDEAVVPGAPSVICARSVISSSPN